MGTALAGWMQSESGMVKARYEGAARITPERAVPMSVFEKLRVCRVLPIQGRRILSAAEWAAQAAKMGGTADIVIIRPR